MGMEPLLIPQDEIDFLVVTAGDALALAQDGRLARGYTLLHEGRQRVKEARRKDEPWADELASAWERVVDHYVERCADNDS